MPDITMCSNKNCYVKHKCYRSQAIPNLYQSYANFDYDDNNGNCFKEMPKNVYKKTNE